MKSKSPQPNFILFLADEMRADALGAYGNPVCKTPNFDALAKNGTLFTQCHAQFPVCGASRCSLLTGWPASVRGHRSLYYLLRPDEPNLFRSLRHSGYDVFWFGKNDALSAASFDDSVTEWCDSRPSSAPEMILTNGSVTPGAVTMLYPPAQTDRTETGDYLNLRSAIEILERRELERPFCIFLPLLNPHPPYRAPADFHDLYRGEDIPPLAPRNLSKKPDFHAGLRNYCRLTSVPEATLRKLRAVYLGQVSYTDWLFGVLMEALARTGHSRNTVVVVSSDHGDYAGDYGLVEKWPSGLEDCLTRVPLIASVPGGTAGNVVTDMTELFDIMPTMLELAGSGTRHTHFARSFTRQLHGAPGDPRRAAFSEGGYNTYEPQVFEPIFDGIYEPKTRLQNEHPEQVARCASIRTRTHKLIVRPGGQSEFYDCDVDPNLTDNLIDDASSAGVVHSLQEQLLTWYVSTTGVAATDKDPRGLPAMRRSG